MLVLLQAPSATAAAAVEGRARFTDADTLTIGRTTIRLFGIDAPELDQTCKRADGRDWACGKWALRRARALFGGKPLRCDPVNTDRYGRTVARCWHGQADVAEVLVRQGVATAYRRYSRRYIPAEKEASLADLGIWAGTLQTPEDFRAATAPRTQPQPAPPGQCAIKGNISKNGRIYHLPGQKFYDVTRISPSRGERWFCTEAEARAAGWRRARQ